MAGALGLKLAGPRVYGETLVGDAFMGQGRREAGTADIRRALRLYRRGAQSRQHIGRGGGCLDLTPRMITGLPFPVPFRAIPRACGALSNVILSLQFQRVKVQTVSFAGPCRNAVATFVLRASRPLWSRRRPLANGFR